MQRQAAIYVRISFDPNATRLGVTRQRIDCERKAKQRGWTVAEVFEDNDVSASSGKRRPEYERMLQAIRDGRINAVVVWDLDRLTRRPIEIEQFIELADQHSVELASVGGDIDLATDTGRMVARIMGAAARHEIDHKSRRQKAANVQRREMGKPHISRRSFGYTADGMDLVPAEATAIREAAAALLSGASVHGITRSLNARGLLSAAGGRPWDSSSVRRMLMRPKLAGLASYRGELTGGEGAWPAILDPDTHHAILGVLADPARHKAGRPRTYLLSGTATCDRCGERLFGGWDKRRGYATYRCPSRAHISRKVDDIDAHVTGVVLTKLAEPAAIGLFTRPDDDGRADELHQEQRALRARLDGLAEAFAAGDIDRAQLTVGTRRLNARLGEVTGQLAAIVRQPDLSVLVGAADVWAAWGGLEVERRRQAVRSLLAAVVVHSAGQGARRFDPATVQITWR